MAARRVQRRTSTPRRMRVWGRDFATATGLVNGAPHIRDVLAPIRDLEPGTSIMGSTVGRVKIDFAANRTAAVEVGHGAIGLGLLVAPRTLDALDASPILHLHLDWMLWRKLHPRDDGDRSEGQWTIDVKAMRRLQEANSTLWLLAETFGGDTFSVSYGTSALLILP